VSLADRPACGLNFCPWGDTQFCNTLPPPPPPPPPRAGRVLINV